MGQTYLQPETNAKNISPDFPGNTLPEVTDWYLFLISSELMQEYLQNDNKMSDV